MEHLEDRRLLAVIPFTLSIPTVVTIDDADPDVTPFSDDPDYYAVVTIGNNPEIESSEVSGQRINPDWVFTAPVDTADNPIRVEIQLYDDDGGLRFDDDHLDISSIPGRKGLFLDVDLTTGTWVEVDGSLAYPDRSSEGNGDDYDARLFFEIDSDSDGLFNRWEIDGLDIDDDGTIDLDLPALGAQHDRKDVFVEVDAMNNRAPLALPPVTDATNASPIVIQSTNHGLTTGTRVSIQGVTGNTAANGVFTVTRVDNNRFSLDGSTGNGFYSAGGNWSLNDLVGTGLATGTSLDLVVNSFFNAPVPNPDGSMGINLHTELDELTLPRQGWDDDADGDGRSPYGEDLNANGALDPGEDANGNGTLDGGDPDDQGGWLRYQQLRQSNFGTPAQRASVNATAILDAKEAVYRYGPFTDFNVSRDSNQGVTRGVSGWKYNDNSFIVSLGRWSTRGGTVDQQAGTFMHELGHTLGLGHGGGDGINDKPNYFSVMNYTWQVPNRNFPESWRLDYSTGSAPDLDEGNLNENAGLGGTAGLRTQIGPPVVPPGSPPGTTATLRIVSQTGPIDFDLDGVIENSGAIADLNDFTTTPDGSPGQLLQDNNDWGKLKYRITQVGAGFVNDLDEPDFTAEQFSERNQILQYSLPIGNGSDSITLRKNGDNLEIVDDSTGIVLVSQNALATRFVDILGASGEGDQLTVEFTGGNPIPAGGLEFLGGPGVGVADTLRFRGDLPGTAIYNQTNTGDSSSGELVIGGSLITFTGLEHVGSVTPQALQTRVNDADLLEGETVTLSGEFLDAGSLSQHTVMVDWGNGETSTHSLAVGARSFSVDHLYRDDVPTTTPLDNYQISVRVLDNEDLSSPADTSAIVVRNVPPQIAGVVLAPAAIDEGQTVTVRGNFSDPALGVSTETFGGSAVWSDGVATTLVIDSSTGFFSTSRTFSDDNPTGTPQDEYTVLITISDDDGGEDTLRSGSLLVRNVAPLINDIRFDRDSINENESVVVSGTFTDPALGIDTFQGSAVWSDGVVTELVVDGAAGSFRTERFFFDDDPTATLVDPYAVSITIRDDDTGTDTRESSVLMVHNVAPSIVDIRNSAVPCGDIGENDEVTLEMEWADPGSLDTFTARVAWGDGNEDIYHYGAGTRSLLETHAYSAGGIYQATVTLTDDDTGETSTTTVAYIVGVGTVNGTLYALGTNESDRVHINPTASGDYLVHATFLPDSPRLVSGLDVEQIVILLCGGDDTGSVAGAIELPVQIQGGEGNDILNGGGGLNVLLGQSGADQLIGGSRSDLIIGGDGEDSLQGNKGIDLLIAGATTYDGNALPMIDHLFAILKDFDDDGQLQAENVLNDITVLEDESVDQLLGVDQRDMLFYTMGMDHVRGNHEPR